MKRRCTSTVYSDYQRYGGAGITFDPRWDSYDNFLEDMGPRPEGKTLDRIDGSKVYSKETCRWATLKEQANNRHNTIRLPSGETLWDHCKANGINYFTIWRRIFSKGMSMEQAVSLPIQMQYSRKQSANDLHHSVVGCMAGAV